MFAINKRYPRELKHKAGTYLSMFLLTCVIVSQITGYLAGIDSLQHSVSVAHEKACIEDFNFSCDFKLTQNQIDKIESLDTKLEVVPNFSHQTTFTLNDSSDEKIIRIYSLRDQANIEHIVKGRRPASSREIALNRTFCETNNVSIGDTIEVDSKRLEVVGFVALPEHEVALVHNTDFIFNNVGFTQAVVASSLFDKLNNLPCSYDYAVRILDKDKLASETYADARVCPMDYVDRIALEKQVANLLMDDKATLTSITDHSDMPSAEFADTDFIGDRNLLVSVCSIILVVVAFIFSVITNSTIQENSSAIGTLLASGYRKRELVIHYMTLPVICIVLGCLAGLVLGRISVFNKIVSLYYKSYNLPTFITYINYKTLLIGVLAPVVVMVFVTWVGIRLSLRAEAIAFLRHEANKPKHRLVTKLKESWPFSVRMHLRIISANLGRFIVLFLGVVFGSMLMFWGIVELPLMCHYSDEMARSLVADHTYLLKCPLDIKSGEKDIKGWEALDKLKENEKDLNVAQVYKLQKDASYLLEKKILPNNSIADPKIVKDAEEALVLNLECRRARSDNNEEVSVYGTKNNSKYFKFDYSKDDVIVTKGFAIKCGIKIGEPFDLIDKTTGESYRLVATEISDNESGINIYMPIEKVRQKFKPIIDERCKWILEAYENVAGDFNVEIIRSPLEAKDYFNAVVSNKAIDINSDYLIKDIEPSEMYMMAKQLQTSMSEYTKMVVGITIPLAFITIYLITKTILDSSAIDISRFKVFGYYNSEIFSMYIRPVTICFILSMVASFNIILKLVEYLVQVTLAEYTGNMAVYYEWTHVVKAYGLCLACYVAVVLIHKIKLKKVPEILAMSTFD